MKLTILAGSNRPGGSTRKIAAQLAGFYTIIGQPAEIMDLADLPPEIYSPTSYEEKPASFRKFSDAILASDGVHIVAPEYNGGPPGVLKYFIDMLKFPESFERRPVAFTGVSLDLWGALRSIEQLQAIFAYRNAHLFPTRVFLPGIARLLSAEGRLTDPELIARLREQAAGFVKFVGTLRP